MVLRSGLYLEMASLCKLLNPLSFTGKHSPELEEPLMSSSSSTLLEQRPVRSQI